MRVLINEGANDHLGEILTLLEQCDEVRIATAYLKMSGLSKIVTLIRNLLQRGGQVEIVAGQNFGLTEPKALHELRILSEVYPTNRIFLANANGVKHIFHPKLYLFRNGSDGVIIAGSANITEGGLTLNKECSLIHFCKTTSDEWLNAKSFFDSLVSPDAAEIASLLVIKKYESFYESQKKVNKASKAKPPLKKSQINFTYGQLQRHFLRFDNAARQTNFEEKTFHYHEAREVLNTIADHPRLTQATFEPLLDSLVSSQGEYGWWHSGSLFRLRRKVYRHYAAFQQMVQWIRTNCNATPAVVFSGAKDMVSDIEGASVNYVTEIMMTYNYDLFANLNKNPITVLRKEGGLNIKAASESFTPEDYQEYCELVKEISGQLGLVNMLEADSFFNTIYWKLQKSSSRQTRDLG